MKVFLTGSTRGNDCTPRVPREETDVLPHLSSLGWEHIGLTGDYNRNFHSVKPGARKPVGPKVGNYYRPVTLVPLHFPVVMGMSRVVRLDLLFDLVPHGTFNDVEIVTGLNTSQAPRAQ